MKFKNYYQILNLSSSASAPEIKKAYYSLAKKHHPDMDSENNMIYTLNEAYNVLSDPVKKNEYDIQLKQLNAETRLKVIITTGDILAGKKIVIYNRMVKCHSCDGAGNIVQTSEDDEFCPLCGGSGKIIFENPDHAEQPKNCHLCSGTGSMLHDKCQTCSGTGLSKSEHEVQIDTVMLSGDRIILKDEGDYITSAESFSDLIIDFQIDEVPGCRILGDGLIFDLHCNVFDILLENEITVKEDGQAICTVQLSGDGTIIPGKPLHRYFENRKIEVRFNLIPEFPVLLSRRQKSALEKLLTDG